MANNTPSTLIEPTPVNSSGTVSTTPVITTASASQVPRAGGDTSSTEPSTTNIGYRYTSTMYTEASRYSSEANPKMVSQPYTMPSGTIFFQGAASGLGPPRRRQMNSAVHSTIDASVNRQNSIDTTPSDFSRSLPTMADSEYDNAVAPDHSAPRVARRSADGFVTARVWRTATVGLGSGVSRGRGGSSWRMAVERRTSSAVIVDVDLTGGEAAVEDLSCRSRRCAVRLW